MWLPKDDLKHASSWSSPPLVLLRDNHSDLLPKYDFKDSAPLPALPGVRTRPGRDSQDGVSQEQETSPLFVPQLDRLYEANLRGKVASNAVAIPAEHRVTQ